LRLIAIHDFYKRIGDAASKVFLAVDHKHLEAVLIGGPSPTKEEFEDGEYFHHELQKKVLGLFDTSYTDESGLSELVDNASDALMNLDVIKEKKYMERFLKELVGDGEDKPELAPCKKCKGTVKVTDSTDVVDELSTLADQMSTQIVFISTDFEEGAQLMNAFGPVDECLRGNGSYFKVQDKCLSTSYFFHRVKLERKYSK